MTLKHVLRHTLLALALLSPVATATDAVQISMPRQDNTIGLRYLVFETGGAGAEDSLPMIVGLHYSGAEPQVMVEYFDTLNIKARIVLPRGPYARPEGRSWFPAELGVMGQAAQDAVGFDSAGKLAEFMAAARERHPTRGKPVVVGVSFGGDMALLLALRHPNAVAAAFPVAARLLPGWIPAANTCKPHCPPIRALHGEDDATVAIGPTREGVARLSTLDYDASLASYPGVAHDFDARMERDFAEQARKLVTANAKRD